MGPLFQVKPIRLQPGASSRRTARILVAVGLVVVLLGCLALPLVAQDAPEDDGAATRPTSPNEIVESLTDREQLSSTLELLILLTVLTLAPAILIMTTCFTRVVVVLSLVRQALAVQQLPPNQVLIGLSLFITFMVMGPTWVEVHRTAVAPYINGEIDSPMRAWEIGKMPIRRFMFEHTDENDLLLFLDASKSHLDKDPAALDFRRRDVPTHVLMPAFVLSELKRAFLIGFLIYLPFLIIDMVVASTLISMGMLVLPPVLISLPFKLLLFVLVDGWYLIVGSLLASYM